MKQKIVSLFLIFVSIIVFSQEKKKQTVFYKEESIVVVLKDLEKKFAVKFSYPSDLVTGVKISLEEKKRNLDDILFEITYLTNIQFNKIDDTYIYLHKINSEKLNEIVVRSYLTTGISKNKDATYILNPKKIGLLAGLTETDILESIQQLPGVISINETATELAVRGGNSDQNRILWDGINIYHSGHLFGMVSVFNPNIAQEISFHNKGTNARFGERISSVIDISTSRKIPKKSHFEFGINGISSDVFLETPFIDDKLSVQTSFRRSYEDLIETTTFKRYEEKAFQNTKILEEKFHFKDYNTKINFIPNKKNSLYFSLIHIDNDLFNDHKEENSNTAYSDELDSENEGYSIEWHKKWNDNISLNTNISHSHYSLFYNYKVTKNNLLFSNYSKNNTIKDTEFYTIVNIKLANNNKLDVGYQSSLKKVTFLFKEEKDIVYTLDKDNSKINTHALFASYRYKNPKTLYVYSGLRINYYSILNKFRVEPRLVITKTLNNYFKLQLTGEIKNQIISQIDETVLSNLSLEKKIWRLADGNKYPIINSRQISSSFLFYKNKWSADVDLYYKKIKGITALSLGFLNPIDNSFHLGEQKVVGLDFYVKREFNAFKTWISYSFIDVQNKYDTLNNNTYFRANNDIKHAISASANYTINKFDIALCWKYRTGRPLTDLDYDSAGNAFFDGINTERLPDYHRLDLSSTYKFSISKKNHIQGKIGFSIRNVYNQNNHLSTDFIGNNAINDPVRVVNNYSIGFTPNFLFRLYW